MNPSHASTSTRMKVGIFTLLGLALIGAITVFVNDKPYWWRPCQLVRINIEDATGLKSKSPVRSLGLEIGYLNSVELSEVHVTLGICITAPVEVLPSTRAYIRGEGFLGDKFVELKPVKYIGPRTTQRVKEVGIALRALAVLAVAVPDAYAAKEEVDVVHSRKRDGAGREIPVGQESQDVQQLVTRVDDLVNEMTNLTTNLKAAINPEELRATMRQLNRTLENASKTLSPEGGLNQTAQRSLAKLEDAIEQFRDLMARVNSGEGSVGMLLNDPVYADEIREAVGNINRLLSKVGGVRFVVDIGGEMIGGYDSGRGWFRLQIYPKADRYYLIGISLDPRGRRTSLTTTTTSGGISTITQSTTLEQTGLLLTGMVGKILYRRIDLAIGALNGDGTFSAALLSGPRGRENMLVLQGDLYSRGSGTGADGRVLATIRPWQGNPNPWSTIYVKGGIESFNRVNGVFPYFYGAGVSFDDEDILLLFSPR
jgi:phospholipid/cholesterol/gamma-HCH transport system substrate-binding protein